MELEKIVCKYIIKYFKIGDVVKGVFDGKYGNISNDMLLQGKDFSIIEIHNNSNWPGFTLKNIKTGEIHTTKIIECFKRISE